MKHFAIVLLNLFLLSRSSGAKVRCAQNLLFDRTSTGDLLRLASTEKHYKPHISSTLQSVLRQRGGEGEHPLFINNPSYIPPQTVGDIESLSSRTAPSFNQNDDETKARGPYLSARTKPTSLLEFTSQYARNLYNTNPALAKLAVSCFVVFSFWQIPTMTLFLNKYFVCSRRNLMQGRWLSLLLSAISHSDLWHLIFNLAALLSLGPEVQLVLGRQLQMQLFGRHYISSKLAIWLLVVGAALSGSVAYLLLGEIRSVGGGCLGLSAVTMSLLSFYAKSCPERILHIRLAGIVPLRLPAYQLLQCVYLWSIVGCLVTICSPQRSDGIAHSAHLGGLTFGMVYYELIINRVRFVQQLTAARGWFRHFKSHHK
jgi:membrane associated rhomboid family serine protease